MHATRLIGYRYLYRYRGNVTHTVATRAIIITLRILDITFKRCSRVNAWKGGALMVVWWQGFRARTTPVPGASISSSININISIAISIRISISISISIAIGISIAPTLGEIVTASIVSIVDDIGTGVRTSITPAGCICRFCRFC
jgi:hypothetical protein